MRQETVDIVEELVGRMQPTINIDSIIDNGNSTYTIITSNTSYVAPNTTLTIGGNEYVVLSDNSFVFNEQFTVSGSVNPSGTTEIILDVLHYKHGTAMATNSELSRIQLGIDKYPLVYLLEVIEDDFNNDENLRLDRTSDLRLFFLSETKEESWTTDQHYEYSIKPMRNMAYDFIKFLNKITLIGEFDTYKIFNYAKFGVYTPQKGSISRIFNDKLSGAELRINLPILKTNKCSNDKEISVVCESGKVTNSDETFVDFVMSGGTKVLPDTKVTDSDGQVYYQPSVNDVVCTPGGGSADVTNSNGSYNETVNAGDTLILNDIDNVDTDGTVVPTPAQTPFTCSAPDNTILNLNFLDTASTVEFKGDSLNAGVYRADACGLDLTEISVSTDDGTTFTPLSFPFTIVNGVDYIFKRANPDATNQFNSFRIIPSVNTYMSEGGITTDSLVLHLDNSNPLSYSGTGSEMFDLVNNRKFNLINNPTYTSGKINYNGVDEYATQDLQDFEINFADSFTILVVARLESGHGLYPYILTFKTSQGQDLKIFYSEQTGNGGYKGITYGGSITGVGGMARFRNNQLLTKNTYFLIELSYDNSSIPIDNTKWTMRLNEVVQSKFPTGNVTNRNFNTIANNNDGSFPFKGQIPEVAVYNKLLSPSERTQNVNFLKAKFGII